MSPLTTGQVAKKADVNKETIRYYEQLGLIQASGRTSGGFRLFDPSVLTRLAFIKRTQSLGLSLQESKLEFAYIQGWTQGCYPVSYVLVPVHICHPFSSSSFCFPLSMDQNSIPDDNS